MAEGNNHIKMYTAEDIQSYLDGRMNASEMHALELAALEDPFLADAIEGYKNAGIAPANIKPELSEALQERLRTKRIVLPAWLKIAAAVAVVTSTIVAISLVMNERNTNKAIVASQKAPARQDTPALTFIQPDSTALVYEQPDVPKLQSVEAPSFKKLEEKKLSPLVEAESSAPGLMSESESKGMEVLKADASARKSVISDVSSAARGIVIDSNKQPIPGATVTLDQQQVVTNEAGIFVLKPTDSLVKVEVQSAGFATKKASLNSDPSLDTIMLSPSNQALDEVVVTGYGVKRPKRLFGRSKAQPYAIAFPSISWEEYNQYIVGKLDSSSLGMSVETEVVISFLADSSGKLSKFRVEKPASTRKINEFLIEVIKTGPQWQVNGGKSARGTVRIQLGPK